MFADRTCDLTRPLRPFSGLHLLAFPFGDEFQHGQRITRPAGGLLSFDPDVRSVTLENLSCQVRDHLPPRSPGTRPEVRGPIFACTAAATRGTTLIDGAVLPAGRPFLDLQYLGQSVVGSAYITAQGGFGIAVGGTPPACGSPVHRSTRPGAAPAWSR